MYWLAFVFSLGALIVLLSYLTERWEWNQGISRVTGTPWIPFATDSSGAEGFKDIAGTTIWVSWRSIM